MTAILTPLTIPFANSRTDNIDPGLTNDPDIVNQPYGFPVNQSLDPSDVNFKPVTEEQMNGTFNFYTNKIYQQGLGKQYTFDQDVSDATPDPHGYPEGAILYCAFNNTYQRSLVNNNTANFVTNTSYINDGVNWKQMGQEYMPDINDNTTSHTINVTGAGGLVVTNNITNNGNISTNGTGSIVTGGSGNIAAIGTGQIYTTNGNITAGGSGYIGTVGSGNISTLGSGSIISNGGIISKSDIHCTDANIYTGTGANGGAVLWHDGRISAGTYYGNNATGRPIFPGAGRPNNLAAVLGDILAAPYSVAYGGTVALISFRNDGYKNVTISGAAFITPTASINIPISVYGFTSIISPNIGPASPAQGSVQPYIAQVSASGTTVSLNCSINCNLAFSVSFVAN